MLKIDPRRPTKLLPQQPVVSGSQRNERAIVVKLLPIYPPSNNQIFLWHFFQPTYRREHRRQQWCKLRLKPLVQPHGETYQDENQYEESIS